MAIKPECKARIEEHMRKTHGKDFKLTAAQEARIEKTVGDSMRNVMRTDRKAFAQMSEQDRRVAAGIDATERMLRKADASAKQKQADIVARVSNIEEIKAMAATARAEGGTREKGWGSTVTEGVSQQYAEKYGTKINDMPHVEAALKMMSQTYLQKEGAKAALHGELGDLLGALKEKFHHIPYLNQPGAEEFMGRVFVDMAGGNSGDAAAKAMASKLMDMFEGHRLHANELGANIDKLKDFLPQNHDGLLVKNAGQKDWVDYVYHRIDKTDFIDDAGNQRDEAAIRDILGEMWESIVTNGNNKKIYNEDIAQIEGPIGGRTVMERASSFTRKINFVNAEAHMEYHQKFSRLTPVGLVLDHLTRTAEDLTIIERHGPDAVKNLESVIEIAHKLDDAHASDLVKSAPTERARKKINVGNPAKRKVFGVTANQALDALIHRESDFQSHFATAVRWLTSMHAGTKLTRTTVRAVPQDLNTVAQYSAELGQGAKVAAMFKAYAQKATREELRRVAIGTSFIEQSLSNISRRINTQTGKMRAIGWAGIAGMNRMAYETAHLGGLQSHTNAMKAVGEQLHGSFLADQIEHSWAELHQGTKQLFTEAGITERNWELIQKVPMLEMEGFKVPDVTRLHELNLTPAEHNEIARSVRGFMLEGANKITYEKDLLARSAMNLGAPGNSPAAALLQTMFLFKGVASVIAINLNRRWERRATLGGKLASVSGYAAGATVAGYLGNQAINLLDGKQMQDINDWRTWGDAFVKGGGLGYYGDILVAGWGAETQTAGASNAYGMLGPSGSDLGDLIEISALLWRKVTGNERPEEEGKLGFKFVRFVRNHIPLMNLWYTKLATDRLLMDHVYESLMPGYQQHMVDLANKHAGSYWWQPGASIGESATIQNPFAPVATDEGAMPIIDRGE